MIFFKSASQYQFYVFNITISIKKNKSNNLCAYKTLGLPINYNKIIVLANESLLKLFKLH